MWSRPQARLCDGGQVPLPPCAVDVWLVKPADWLALTDGVFLSALTFKTLVSEVAQDLGTGCILEGAEWFSIHVLRVSFPLSLEGLRREAMRSDATFE